MPSDLTLSRSHLPASFSQNGACIAQFWGARTPRFANGTAAVYRLLRSADRESRIMAGGTLASNLFEHRASLLRYLRARGAADEAEDVLQELWFRLRDVDAATIGDDRAYLFKMAHNLLIDRKRGDLRRERREREFQDVRGMLDHPSAERAAIAREELDGIGRMLRDLGPRTDYIFRRHRLDLVPQRAIAEELGISLSAVEKHLQRAYRALGTRADEQALPQGTRGAANVER